MQPIGPRPKSKKRSKNAPTFDLRTELYRMTGIDWAQINGIDVLTAQTVIAEVGADRNTFPSEKQFTSGLGLCPTPGVWTFCVGARRTWVRHW
jgi:transposase